MVLFSIVRAENNAGTRDIEIFVERKMEIIEVIFCDSLTEMHFRQGDIDILTLLHSYILTFLHSYTLTLSHSDILTFSHSDTTV